MTDWPPKFTITPRGVANLFLLHHCPGAGAAASHILTELIYELLRQMAEQTKEACAGVEGISSDAAANIRSLKLELDEE